MRGGKGYLTLGLVVAAFLVAAASANSYSSGIDRSTGFTEEGCTCHGPAGGGGLPNENVHLLLKMEPSTPQYEPGVEYLVTVGPAETDVVENPDGNKGGFNLLANHGTLSAAPGFEEFTQFHQDVAGWEATHTFMGDAATRTYQVIWTAPAADEGPVVFTLFVNTVNGDAMNNELDHWNAMRVIVPGPSGELSLGGAEADPTAIGVRWLAHWVGLISFVAVVATLVIYYFVLKYSESIHTTDHRDRQDK